MIVQIDDVSYIELLNMIHRCAYLQYNRTLCIIINICLNSQGVLLIWIIFFSFIRPIRYKFIGSTP